MGVVTKTIGTTGRDYSTLQAWEDALPANLVTDGNSQVGLVYKDTEFTTGSSVALTISGETTDASNTITLEAAPGQSFIDDSGIRTNPLSYDATKGVAIRSSGSPLIDIQANNVTVRRLQIKNTGANRQAIRNAVGPSTNFILDQCIIEGDGDTGSFGGSGTIIKNCIIINNGATATATYVVAMNGGSLINCTMVVRSSLSFATAEVALQYTTAITIKNCALFGATALSAGAGITFTNCYNERNSPPSGVTQVVYGSSLFVNTASDWRVPIGSSLIDTGVADSVNSAFDITNTARPQGSAYDVGCWEYSSGSSAPSIGGFGKGYFGKGSFGKKRFNSGKFHK
jgi:hypothetical protein